MDRRLLLQRLFASITIPLLLYFTFLAGKWGIASVYATLGLEGMRSWTHTDTYIKADWQESVDYLHKAVELHPKHPDYLYQLGRAYQFRNLQERQPIGEQDLIQALHYYDLSTLSRPYWPLAWAHIALAKASLGQIDAEFENAILKATEYGPWEPGVHMAVGRAGFQSWQQLDLKLQEVIIQNNVRGVKSPAPGQFKRMTSLLRAHNRQSLVCPYLPREKRFLKFCSG